MAHNSKTESNDANNMYEVTAIAKISETGGFEKITIKRNITGDDDVEFDIKFCGICHTDAYIAQNEFPMPTQYPCIPGHELAGVVTKVGKNVKNLKAGQKVGVGCIVDSCLDCDNCKTGDENYCEKGMTMTYGWPTVHGRIQTSLGYTAGGYSNRITVNEKFIIRIPDEYPLEKAGPLFCAGITTYSPLRYWGAIKGGKKVGVVGIGGLGQMAIQQARAMGNEVFAISTSPQKETAAKKIGAHHFIVSSDPEAMKSASSKLDLILNTVSSANHQCMVYIPLLRTNGMQILLGVTQVPQEIPVMALMPHRKGIASSGCGNIQETQDCMDFCHKHNIQPETQLVLMEDIQNVYKKLSAKNDSLIRYVLNVEKSLEN